MITIQYKKKGWIDWCYWPCRNVEEARAVVKVLVWAGYEVHGG